MIHKIKLQGKKSSKIFWHVCGCMRVHDAAVACLEDPAGF